MSREDPLVATKADVDRYDGDMVRVVGRYTEIDVRKAPTKTPAYDGHVAIELEDGTRVLLLPVWDQEAIRPPEEIAHCKDQQVVVEGTIAKTAPSSRDGRANLLMPCLLFVLSVQLAEFYDLTN